MAKGKHRVIALTVKEQRKVAQHTSGGVSNYARKSRWLARHGVWGFDVPEPKPWRKAK